MVEGAFGEPAACCLTVSVDIAPFLFRSSLEGLWLFCVHFVFSVNGSQQIYLDTTTSRHT